MFNKLPEKWQNFIIKERRNKIKKIAKNKEMSKFFDSLCKTRDFDNMTVAQQVATLVYLIDLTVKTKSENYEEELQWLKKGSHVSQIHHNSALTTVDTCYGFEYLNI